MLWLSSCAIQLKRGITLPADPNRLGPRPVENDPHERRRSTRYPFVAGAEVIEPESNTAIAGRTSDLGRGGCFIDTLNPFPPGTIVRVRLTLEQCTFEAHAKVVYSINGIGMGLLFKGVQPGQARVLEGWIARLSGKAMLEPLAYPPEATPVPPPAATPPAPDADFEPRFVLNELIIILMRKRVLSEAEGKSLLQKLMS
jgi:PilZ domain